MKSPAGSPAFAPLPDATRPGTVRLQVADLARSLDWYQSVLGLAVLDRQRRLASLGVAGTGVLVELHELPGALPVPRRGRLGLFHYAILLPDRAALGRFLAHQIALQTPLGASDHLVSEATYLTDPDGLGIEVYCDRPRSSWQARDGELAMATLPLDAEGVLAAGGGTAWTGMPRGTVMGHVHLHVGHLAEASRFYHQSLGLAIMVSSYPGALFLAAGGYHHHLGLNTWAGSQATAPGPGDARLLEWELILPDSAAVRARGAILREAGYPPEDTDRGLLVRDPWGTTLHLQHAT